MNIETGEEYNSDYFNNGEELGISLYKNYRWMPELTINLAKNIITHLNIQNKDTVLDIGCAKGYLVKALRILNIKAYGCDISKYAITNCDQDVKKYCIHITNYPQDIKHKQFSWIISKDVIEHMDEVTIYEFLKNSHIVTKKMFHIIPLGDGKNPIIEQYALDKTHKTFQTKEWWLKTFREFGWKVIKFDYSVKGIKEKWTSEFQYGNGFFILEKE